MQAAHRFVDGLSNVLFGVAMIAGALMMLHVTADVIARTVFHHPLTGVGEITATYYMIAVAFLPWAAVTMRDEHITADLFLDNVAPWRRRIIDSLIDCLTIAYVAAFTWQSWLSAMSRTERGEVWEIFGGYLPIWPTRWLLPVAGGAMVLVLIFRLIARLTGHDPATGRRVSKKAV